MALPGFIFGGSTQETPESLKRKRQIAQAILGERDGAPRNVGEGLNSIGQAILYRSLAGQIAGGEAQGAKYNSGLRDSLLSGMASSAPFTTGVSGAGETVGGSVAPASSGRATAGADLSGNPIYAEFIGEVGKGITNPYGLAAVAATGNHESRFSSGNIGREWSDPSESGQAGSAGGILSWRAERLNNLKQFTARNGGSGLGSAATQAQFFLQENPQLVSALNNAKSVEEAQSLMNGAWKFAGYNRPGGEAGRRLATARSFLGQFQNGAPKPVQVASLDPSSGMDTLPDTTMGYQGQVTQNLPGTMMAPGFRPEATPLASVGEEVELPEVVVPGEPKKAAIRSAITGETDPWAGMRQANATTSFPPAPLASQNVQVAQAGGPSLETLYRVYTDPMADEQTRALAGSLLERRQAMEDQQRKLQMEQSDPLRQLQLRKAQLEIDTLESGGKKRGLINAGDGKLYDPNTNEWITAPTDEPTGGGFRFKGNSVDAQALNGLMDSGKLTEEQAQNIAAGKTVTGPNGEILFMTAQGLMGIPAGGGDAQPIVPSSPSQLMNPNSLGGAPMSPRVSSPEAMPQAPRQNSVIPLTEPKVTVDEKKAGSFAARMSEAGSIIDKFENVGTDRGQAWANSIPFGFNSLFTSNDYKKLDQAKRSFINAQLRRESGAVIGEDEFRNADIQYFPQPGDTPEVIEQKRRERQLAIQNMGSEAGPTYRAPGSNKSLKDKYGLD